MYSTLELPYTTKLEVEAAAAAARDEQNKDAVSSNSLAADAGLRKQAKTKKIKVAPVTATKGTCVVGVCSLHAACTHFLCACVHVTSLASVVCKRQIQTIENSILSSLSSVRRRFVDVYGVIA